VTRDLRRAIDLYERFHQFEPTDIGEFHPDFHIPRYGYDVGEAERIYYRSDKLNPETGEDEGEIDYVHFFEPGVRLFRFDCLASSKHQTAVPLEQQISALTRIGFCSGFSFQGERGLVCAKAVGAPPELYAIPLGAVFLVQGCAKVIAACFGARLAVRPAGILG